MAGDFIAVAPEPVLHRMEDHVQGQRGAPGNADLHPTDNSGAGVRTECLPEHVMGGGQPGQVTVQIDGTLRPSAQLLPTRECGRRGRLATLPLERMETLQRFAEAKGPENPLGPAEL